MYEQKPCGSCHFRSLDRNHVGQISSPLETFWSLHDLCFSSCWAVCSSAQKSRRHHISSLFEINPPFMFVSQQTAVCLQSHPQFITQHSRYRSWFSPKLCNSSVVGADQDWIHVHSFFVTGPRSVWRGGLGPVVLVCNQLWLLCSHRHKRSAPKRQNELDSAELKEAGVKTPSNSRHASDWTL